MSFLAFFYEEKIDQIGRMIQMDSRDGSDEVLEKPSVEIASYYLAYSLLSIIAICHK